MVRHIKKYSHIILPIIIGTVFSFSCRSYDITENDGNGNSPLHAAVMNGDISMAKKLLDEGADINCTNEQCVTPIRLAAYLKQKEMVQLFIERGVSVNYNQNEARSKNSKLFSNSILKYPEKYNNFFLTFDAGDNNANMDYILDVLKKYHITATFFITGRFMKKYPGDLKRLLADGHVAGNHTYSHSFDYKNRDELLNELYEAEYTFRNITGKELSRIWRAPYLQHLEKPWMLKAARNLGYRHIDVSFYTKDWIPEEESQYLSNERFINFFKKSIDFKNFYRIDVDGTNYQNYRKRNTDYHGIIMLMHTGSFRKKNNDFVYTLEDVILQLISCGYLFDNCQKFED